MLAEAFNQLGRRAVIDALINVGVSGYISEFDVNEEGTYSGNWYGFTLIGQMLVPYTIIQMELQESLAVNMVTRGFVERK